LLVVDQFEEIFIISDDVDERKNFVELLLDSTEDTSGRIHVLTTMRAEFIGECAEFPRLTEAINLGLYLLPRMTSDECREAITRPAALCGGKIEPGLVDQLLTDMRSGVDRLPLLQHALARLWTLAISRSPDQPILALLDYDRIAGSTANALSRHAEEILSEIGVDRESLVAKVFRVLTTDPDGTGNRIVRRPATVREIANVACCDWGDLVAILDAFRAPGRGFSIRPQIIPLSLRRSWISAMRAWHDNGCEFENGLEKNMELRRFIDAFPTQRCTGKRARPLYFNFHIWNWHFSGGIASILRLRGRLVMAAILMSL
jgi:hypothetical protein